MMLVLIMALLGLLAGCGSGGLSDAPPSPSPSPSPTPSPSSVASIGLGTDKATVMSGDSDFATITATALDSSNAVIAGVSVSFSTTGGVISNSSVVTDASGKAVIKFSSGTLNQSNQVVTITAAASGKTAQIPIQVVGSTLTMSSTVKTIPSDGSVGATLTVLAENAGKLPVRDTTVSLTVSPAGSVALSAATGKTGIDGKLVDANGKEVTVTGASAGTATVKAEGLGTSNTIDYTVTGAVGIFSITSPAADPSECSTDPADPAAYIDVTVSYPDASATSKVTFATTLGIWDGKTAIVTQDAAAKTAKARLTSTTAGLATIQVYDPDKPASTDSLKVAFYAPVSSAKHIFLQSSVSVLGLSTGGISKTATLIATVLDSSNAPVGKAPVAFSIDNPTGGGEFISPVVAYTDSSGKATATFTSGSASSGAGGVRINAEVLGSPGPVKTPTPSPTSIVIGGTAGSVVIGRGSKITAVDATTYALPMAVLVADSSGSPVPAGAVVSLKLWPTQYSSGVWYDTDPKTDAEKFEPYITGTFDNDDKNENLIKDSGEESDPSGNMRPPNSAAGTVPPTVTTDANGVATFDLTYLKGSAVWIKDRLSATAVVQGTETRSSITFRLPAEQAEAEAGDLPDSVYPVDLIVDATAGLPVRYTVPALNNGVATSYSTTSLNSTVDAAGVFTFTPAGVEAGNVSEAYVSATGGGVGCNSWIRILAK